MLCLCKVRSASRTHDAVIGYASIVPIAAIDDDCSPESVFGWFVLAGLPQPSCPILSLLLRNDHLHPPSSMQGCAALLPWVRRQRMCRQLMYLKVPFFLRRRNTVAQSLGYVEMGHMLCLCKVRQSASRTHDAMIGYASIVPIAAWH